MERQNFVLSNKVSECLCVHSSIYLSIYSSIHSSNIYPSIQQIFLSTSYVPGTEYKTMNETDIASDPMKLISGEDGQQ